MSNMRAFLNELKKNVVEREARYRAHPGDPAPKGPTQKLEVKVKSVGALDELVTCRASGHEYVISEPVGVGGRNVATWPLEYLLGGAVGCYAAVFAFYAAKLDVAYDEFEVIARTRIDTSGHMIPGAPPSGFQGVDLEVRVVSDAPRDRLEEVERLALDGCPGIDTLRSPTEVTSRLVVAEG